MISLDAAGLSRGFPDTAPSTRTVNQIVAGIALIVNLLIIELFSVYMGVREILIIPTEGRFTLNYTHRRFTLGLRIESHLWNILVTHRVRTRVQKQRRTYASIWHRLVNESWSSLWKKNAICHFVTNFLMLQLESYSKLHHI